MTTEPAAPPSPRPRRGEIWLVDFDPTKGAEIKKSRPAVVISSDSVGKLRLKIVVPCTTWQDKFQANLWMVKIEPTTRNALDRVTTADALQTRSVALERFRRKIGDLEPAAIEDVAAAIATVIEL